jgi:hypothetical protein
MEPTVTLARRFWAAIEPIHSVVYFAPEPLEAARKTGAARLLDELLR